MCLLRMASHQVCLESDDDEPVPEMTPEAAVAVAAAVELPGDGEKLLADAKAVVAEAKAAVAVAAAVSAAVQLDMDDMYTEEGLRRKKRMKHEVAVAAAETPIVIQYGTMRQTGAKWWDFCADGVRGSTDLPVVRSNGIVVAMVTRGDGVSDHAGALNAAGIDQRCHPWIMWPVVLMGTSVRHCKVVRSMLWGKLGGEDEDLCACACPAAYTVEVSLQDGKFEPGMPRKLYIGIIVACALFDTAAMAEAKAAVEIGRAHV